MFLILCFIIRSLSFSQETGNEIVYQTDDLKIIKITENTFQHISYFESQSFGKVPCNGMLVMNNSEAIVFDTPANEKSTVQLIHWLTKILKRNIIAVVPTHFHLDCLAGLDKFHENKIPSFASELTAKLAELDKKTVPERLFKTGKEFKVGKTKITVEYFGEGHTKDNLVAYVEGDAVLFGGCLIKSKTAGKGNLEDANVKTWSETVRKIKRKYKDIKQVIPGHGNMGGLDLLDYTISMFSKE